MGGQNVIGLLKEIRTQLGKRPGDTVTVTLELDRAERAVVIPDDLAAALKESGHTKGFAALSYSHQRQYVIWINEAKNPETRTRRFTETIARLKPCEAFAEAVAMTG